MVRIPKHPSWVGHPLGCADAFLLFTLLPLQRCLEPVKTLALGQELCTPRAHVQSGLGALSTSLAWSSCGGQLRLAGA